MQAICFQCGSDKSAPLDVCPACQAKPGDRQHESAWLSGLGIVQLHRLERLTLQLAGSDMFDAIGSDGRPGEAEPANTAVAPTMELRCDGPLRFETLVNAARRALHLGKEKEAIAIFSENSWTHQKSNQDD